MISDQVLLELDVEPFKESTDMLDATSEPNHGLERLVAIKPPWR